MIVLNRLFIILFTPISFMLVFIQLNTFLFFIKPVLPPSLFSIPIHHDQCRYLITLFQLFNQNSFQYETGQHKDQI